MPVVADELISGRAGRPHSRSPSAARRDDVDFVLELEMRPPLEPSLFAVSDHPILTLCCPKRGPSCLFLSRFIQNSC